MLVFAAYITVAVALGPVFGPCKREVTLKNRPRRSKTMSERVLPRTVAMMYVSAVNKAGNCGMDNYTTHVHLNCVYSPDETKEEHTFWKASPSGSCKMRFSNPADCEQFTPGRKFKVYFTRDDEGGDWVQNENTRGGTSKFDDHIEFRIRKQGAWSDPTWPSCDYDFGELSMRVDNPLAWAAHDADGEKPVKFRIAFMPCYVTE